MYEVVASKAKLVHDCGRSSIAELYRVHRIANKARVAIKTTFYD